MAYLWELPSLSEHDPETWNVAAPLSFREQKKVEEEQDIDSTEK